MPDAIALIARLNEMVQGIATAVLTTIRPDDTLHSCPMATHPVDDSGVLWFLTHNNSEKVEAVRTNQRVNVAYADHASQRYVSVSGFCELVRDHALAKQLWDPSYQSWLPGGPEDPALVLLKVDIQQVEYWDSAKGGMVPLLGMPRIM
jgi:general stress protein 26